MVANAGKIELAEFVTNKTVEKAWGRVRAAQRGTDNSLARYGLRAARAGGGRDRDKLLVALEKGAEIMHHIAEAQMGRTVRDASTEFSHRVWPTEASLWREAYESVDKGQPEEALSWVYAAAALLAGLIY